MILTDAIFGRKKAEPVTTLYTGLFDYWNLEGVSGDVLALNGNNGTVTGTLTRGITGKVGNAFELSGSGYVNVNFTDTGVFLGTGITHSINAWFYKSADVGSRHIMLIIYPINTGGHHWFLEANETMTIGRWGTGSLATTQILPLNQWMMITTTYNSETSVFKIYLNGVVDIETVMVNPFGFSGERMTIGGSTLTAPKFKGKIDEVGLWTRDLTPEEVTLLYNNGNGITL